MLYDHLCIHKKVLSSDLNAIFNQLNDEKNAMVFQIKVQVALKGDIQCAVRDKTFCWLTLWAFTNLYLFFYVAYGILYFPDR